MALNPNSKYPGQTLIASGWPFGKARNEVSDNDGTGTPFEEDWVNDLWGFQQTLLATAGMTPNGNPDRVGASQYLDALRAIIAADLASAGDPVVIGGAGLEVRAASGFYEPITVEPTDAPVSLLVKQDAQINRWLYAKKIEIGDGTINGQGLLRARLDCSNLGRVVHRSQTLDAAAHIYPAQNQWFWVNPAISGIRTYTINETDCVDDDSFGISNPSTSYYTTIVKPSGPPAVTVPANSWASFKRISGTWQKVSGGSLA
ncbi:MAG TPA: hypothetical protein VFQ61_06310 [Polyangiaceae bacterium]|nr:hypothetical protein [Polyangiaceae bacterium]